jgi:glycosyltransferase involved in cell wall biosynthesis
MAAKREERLRPPVRIGLDVSILAACPRAGVGTYVYELARALTRVASSDRFLLYPVFYYFFDPNYRRAELPRAANMETAFRRLPAWLVRHLWEREGRWWGREALLGRVDVVHSTTYCAPRFHDRRKRLVVTIYDVTFATHPELHTPANIAHCLRGTQQAIDRADAVIAISESTRRDLIERMGAPPDRVHAIPLAASDTFSRVNDPARLEAVRSRYDLPAAFILFVGTIEPRKNLARLLAAYAELPPALRAEVALVVTGHRGWLESHLPRRAAELGVAEGVRFTGSVPAEDLPALYSLATLFAYPSISEGFGLPVIEAMACGAPVLTSNAAALPEVVGDAALLVDPLDRDAIARGLARLLEDSLLRESLSRRAQARAMTFSWERTARETLALYQAVSG